MSGTAMAIADYDEMIQEIMTTPYNGRFATWQGVPLKCFEGHKWRNAGWCDRCKEDLVDRVWYDGESNTTLCMECTPKDD